MPPTSSAKVFSPHQIAHHKALRHREVVKRAVAMQVEIENLMVSMLALNRHNPHALTCFAQQSIAHV